ncbi:hypothetical protein IRJ41_021433 [Triplophysa rosa]|uniref:Reelin domain-containing protein n=1 Tax=Triplophysa rosa TaxID=992332 RepID=A0A9W7TLI7_TRIRA|nr:hypothetical protein IRJ41_021433 [Triplophysa rosa]
MQLIRCYSDGTLLEEECQGMNINHGKPPQDGESPFTVKPENKTFNDSEVGQTLTVQLSANSSPFIGFMLEAFKCEECKPAGTFSLTDPSNTVLLSCDGQPGRAVSHADNLDKHSITVTWHVPEAGTFYFRAAFTKTFSDFWLRKPIARLTTAAPRSTPTTALATVETTEITTNGILQKSLQPQANTTAVTTNGILQTLLQTQANTTAITTNGILQTSLQPQANTTAVTTNVIGKAMFPNDRANGCNVYRKEQRPKVRERQRQRRP